MAHPGLPRSVCGKAVRYMLNRWEKLTRFLSDGRIEVDNNLVENAIRPLAVGRKNYRLQVRTRQPSGQRWSILFSARASCTE